MLPCRCQECSSVIKVAAIQEAQLKSDTETSATVDVTCLVCGTLNKHVPKYARGNPRNIAFIGHWDGWQPFGTAAHSCGTTYIWSSCMCLTNTAILLQVQLIFQLLLSIRETGATRMMYLLLGLYPSICYQRKDRVQLTLSCTHFCQIWKMDSSMVVQVVLIKICH